MRTLMRKPEVAVAALCDVDKNRMPNDISAVSDQSMAKAPLKFSGITGRCWNAKI